MFDAMFKIVDEQKKAAEESLKAALDDQHRTTTNALAEQHRILMEALAEQHRTMTQALAEQNRAHSTVLAEICLDLGEFHQRLDRVVHPDTKAPQPHQVSFDDEIGPSGHNGNQPRRGQAHRPSGVYVPPPARGAAHSHPHSGIESPRDDRRSIPRVDFPRFDGTCPKLWQQRCEDYFLRYGTNPALWITVATMQFEGVPALGWLQSIQRH